MTREEGSGTKEDPYRRVVVAKAPVDRLATLALALFRPHRPDDFSSWTAKLQASRVQSVRELAEYGVCCGAGERKIWNLEILLPWDRRDSQIRVSSRTLILGNL